MSNRHICHTKRTVEHMRTVMHRGVTFLLIAMMALPAWSDSNAVGSIVTGSSVRLHNAPLASGSTIFSGDTVSVGKSGNAQIAVTGGTRIAVSSDSTIKLTRNQAAVDLSVARGTATFSGEPKNAFEVVVGNATIRPSQGQSDEAQVSGIIHIESVNSAVVVAQKGSLQIVTADASGVTTVPEGQAARIALASDQPAGAPPASKPAAGPAPAGGPAPVLRTVTAVTLIGGAAVAGIVLERKEAKHSDQDLDNEISPFKPGSK